MDIIEIKALIKYPIRRKKKDSYRVKKINSNKPKRHRFIRRIKKQILNNQLHNGAYNVVI